MGTFINTFCSTVASISPGITLYSRQQFLQEVYDDIGHDDQDDDDNNYDCGDEDDDNEIPFSLRLTDFCCMVS